jgi:5-methylcytosine-specific restriction endonuclease McrA
VPFYLENKMPYNSPLKALEWSRRYYARCKDKINIYHKGWQKECLKSWEGYIPIKNNCQICGKTIYFNKRNPKESIHFDHKKEIKEVRKSPFAWLSKHQRTPKNQKTWESFNFGILCQRCNNYLPTYNRKEYMKRVIKYVFEGNIIV